MENVKKQGFIRELALVFGSLLVMLLPGIFIDGIYYFRYKYYFAKRIVSFFRSFLKPVGVTYTTAFNIMGSNVGVLLAMISLFLTMNINIAQRSEKRVMGISYREIEDINQNDFYKLTKRISYMSPILMLFVLNIRLCVTGYLLFCYCYGFLILHYYLHASSFSTDITREKVAKRLIKCLPQEEKWQYDEIREYDMYLEEVGKGVEDDGDWKEVELLYDKLVQLSCDYKGEQRQIILRHFYKIVYWDRKMKNIIAIFRLWHLTMEDVDKRIAKNKLISEDDWTLEWSMLTIIFCEAAEKDLLDFLEDFLRFKLRSKRTFKSVGAELPEKLLCEQVGAIIILFEYRLRKKLFDENNAIQYIRRLVDYGEKAFLFEDYHIMDIIKFLCNQDEDNSELFLQIAKELVIDFKNGTKRCIISLILK